MPQKIYLIRHGETDYNKERRMQGWIDVPLNDTGLAQAKLTAQALSTHQIHTIYSSDLMRAHQTATQIAAPHRLDVTLTAELRERDMGIFGGWAWESERDAHKDKLWEAFNLARDTEDLDWQAHGGESLRKMSDRVGALLARIHSQHHNQNVVLVTHGGTINRIFEHYKIKKSVEGYRTVGNGAVYILARQSDGTYQLEDQV